MPKKNVIKKNSLVPTILIAGGAGFIGSHISEAALKNKARVVVLDNFSTGKQIHVNHLLDNPNFALYDIDINNGLPEDIETVDYIIHLAGLEEYLYSKDFIDLNSLLTSALGTKVLLDLAKKSDAKFLLLSTVDVYQGMMSQLDIDKYFGQTRLDENKYMITEAKRYAEALVWEYHKKHDLDTRIVRLPEVFGPRMSLDASGQLGSFLKNIIEGKDITVYGDGSSKEMYLYISDAVSGILKALLNDNTKGSIYSLSDKSSISTLELAYIVKGLADREMQVVFDSTYDTTMMRSTIRVPDSFNVAGLVWEPKVDLKTGVIKTLQWFGYDVNTHAFKPAKLIEEKAKEKNNVPVGSDSQSKVNNFSSVMPRSEETPVPSVSKDEELFTLQDIKSIPHPMTSWDKAPVVPIMSAVDLATKNNLDKKTGISTTYSAKPPKLSSPKFLKLPKISFRIQLPPIVSKYKVFLLSFFAAFLPGILLLIILPAVQTYFSLKAGVESLRVAGNSVSQFNSEIVRSESKKAYTHLYNSKKTFRNLGWVFSVIGKRNQFVSINKLISSAAHFSRGVYYGANAVAPFESLWEVVRPDTENVLDPVQFEMAKSELANAHNNILLALADFKYVDKASLPEKIRSDVTTYENYLNLASTSSEFVQPILADLPEVMGATGGRKYLLLFQNSNELRPTGGFIGSYGVLSFDKGKIKELIIDDIYNPDGQIDLRNIQVDPPAPIKTYLKEDKLHIRNSNWDPDFTKSATTIEDLYYRVTGDKVDGVIAMDLYFIKNLLKITGPIFLTAYNEEITVENVYERAQFHSEFNYENGSDQKRSFLTVLGSKLLEKIFNVSREQLPHFLSEINNSLDQRHLLIYFSNSPLNALLENNHWNGAFVKTEGDFINIVNANLGGTKSNYYVKNDYSYNVSSQTRDGVLRGTLVLKYTHTAEDSAWPGGPYTDFVRVYTSLGSKLTAASTKLNSEAPKDIFKEILISDESSKSVFATGFTINPGDTITLTLNYDLPTHTVLNTSNRDYSLYWQKQPGTNDDVVTFTFDKPFGTSIVKKHPSLVLSGDSVSYSGQLNMDYSTYISIN